MYIAERFLLFSLLYRLEEQSEMLRIEELYQLEWDPMQYTLIIHTYTCADIYIHMHIRTNTYIRTRDCTHMTSVHAHTTHRHYTHTRRLHTLRTPLFL